MRWIELGTTPMLLVMLLMPPPADAKDFRAGRGFALPGGDYEVHQELRISYWEDRPELAPELLREHTEYRPFFNYFAPKGVDQPVPGIILIHGGGFGNGHPDEFHKNHQLAPWLASHGYAVFSLGYTLRNNSTRRVAAIDLRQAIRFIRHEPERFNVDPDRLGAWGFSAGGMAMTMHLRMPENGEVEERHENAGGKKVSRRYPTDGGPLADKDIPTRLRVMVFSSGHEVHPKDAEKQIADFGNRMPEAVFIYQAPGEKPWVRGAFPADHPIRKAYESAGAFVDGYGVEGGKHCPSLNLTVEVDGEDVVLHHRILDFLDRKLKGRPDDAPVDGAGEARSSGSQPRTPRQVRLVGDRARPTTR